MMTDRAASVDSMESAPGDLSGEELLARCEIAIEETSPVNRKADVKIPDSVWRGAYGTAMAMMKSEVSLPGFRKGRAPQRVIEKRFGKDFRNEFIHNQITSILEALVEKHHLSLLGEPIYEPVPLELPNEGPLAFTLFIEIVPELPLPDLTSIELARPKFETNDERLNTAMDHLRRTMGVMQPESGPIQKGDHIYIKGTVTQADGTVVQQLEHSRVFDGDFVTDLEIPGLTDILIGKSKGDTFEMTFKAGPQSQNPVAKDIDLSLKGEIIHNSRLILPELNEEFATTNGFENLEDLHKQMREAMDKRLKDQADDAVRSQLFEAFERSLNFPLPDRYFRKHLLAQFEDQARRFADQGIDMKQFEANPQPILNMVEPQARYACKRDIIFRRLLRGEEISVSREEVMDRLLELSQQANESVEAFAERARRTGLIDKIAREIAQNRILDRLAESCKVREVSEAEWKAIVDDKMAQVKAARDQAIAEANARRESEAAASTTSATATTEDVTTMEPSATDAT